VKKKLISLINRLPYIRGLYKEKINLYKNSCFPPGHYYSSIVDVDQLIERQEEIWKNINIDGIDGIDLKVGNQIQLIDLLRKYYDSIPFSESKKEDIRYYFNNGFYSYTDAIILHSMIRHFEPKRIIEVGSGFSSSVMLDTNEIFFDNTINLTFIEPFTERLETLLKKRDHVATLIIQKEVQNVPVDVFTKLGPGDILFIDSTHVSKTGSDLNHLLFNVIPKLNSGVLIHFHDIFYPFEYPKEWVFNGRNWNEIYLIRSFLMYNFDFEVLLFSHYLHLHHGHIFKEMPLCYKNTGGNLWIKRK